MCDAALDTFLFVLSSIPDRHMTQEMCFQRTFYAKMYHSRNVW